LIKNVPDILPSVSVPDHEPVVDGGSASGGGEVGSSFVQDVMKSEKMIIVQKNNTLICK
jgi:hypothetical protein